MSMDQIAAARAELERRMATERCRYWIPNGRLEEMLAEIGRRFPPEWFGGGRTAVVVIYAGNGFGKSCTAVNLASYLCDDYPNEYLDRVPTLRWLKGGKTRRGRILTTRNTAENNYDDEFSKWLRKGRYSRNKAGRQFYSDYSFEKADFDIFTFDQDPQQGESITLRWAIIDEPMSRRHWTALKSRFRFGGLILWVMTPLEGAEWADEVLLTEERLRDDVLLMQASSEDNCVEHGVRGIMPHEALEDQWRDFDEDELETRKSGVPISLGGAIYKQYRDDASGHVMPELSDYYLAQFNRGKFTLWHVVDPHERRPWAQNWRAAFPNGASIALCEWPDMSMKPFGKIKSWTWGYDQYGLLCVETEKALGAEAYATIMDPNYGPSAQMTAERVSSTAEEFSKAYTRAYAKSNPGEPERRRRFIFPSDAITPGHLAVKTLLGDPARGITPLMYWLEHCHNGRFGMRKYGYKENRDEKKGQSEVPTLQHKDFPDLERYYAMAKARYISVDESAGESVEFYRPTVRPNGHVGA